MINANSNSKIKLIRALKSPQGRKKNPYFILENPAHIHDAVSKRPDALAFILHSPENDNLSQLPNEKCYECDPDLLRSESDLSSSSGMIGVFSIPEMDSINVSQDHFPILICDSIEKPANLGAIIRNAAAFKISHIFLTENCVNPFHPTSVKAMAGHCFHTPISTLDDLIMETLISKKIPIYNLDPHSKRSISTQPFTRQSAWIISSESRGLSATTLNKHRDYFTSIAIPIDDNVESLNAAVACGIALFMFNFQLKDDIT